MTWLYEWFSMTIQTTCCQFAGGADTVPHGPCGGGDAACGVAEAVADGADSLPAASIAVTRYVYAVPFVRPLSVNVRVPLGVFPVDVSGQLPSAFWR